MVHTASLVLPMGSQDAPWWRSRLCLGSWSPLVFDQGQVFGFRFLIAPVVVGWLHSGAVVFALVGPAVAAAVVGRVVVAIV